MHNPNEMDEKQYFLDKLRSTGRVGVESVIAGLEELGFFMAPASSNFHLSVDGGLLLHSNNVCREALALREKQIEMKPEVEVFLPVESVIIAALLHDVCKAEIYKPAVKSRRLSSGVWEKYDGYDVDYSAFPMGHGEKSVIRLLQWGLEMTDEEMLAIRWHMNAWNLPFHDPESKGSFNMAQHKTPLLALIIAADGLASHVLER